jgi:uncharacterized damage-inducible protein DinB
MDLLDRLLGHDLWTTQQLLQQCHQLSDAQWDQHFAIDHGSLRETFDHMIGNLEIWTDLLYERPAPSRDTAGQDAPEQLQARLRLAGREFAAIARTIARENRYDDVFMDTLDNPPVPKPFGGAIAHVITHNMHHRAHIMWLMEQLGLRDHIEGDLLSWETMAFGW